MPISFFFEKSFLIWGFLIGPLTVVQYFNNLTNFKGAFAQATLKAAVINAENRNRLTEEDKCWRDKSKEKSRKRKAEEKNSLLEQENDRIKVTRLKAKKHIDKWVSTKLEEIILFQD